MTPAIRDVVRLMSLRWPSTRGGDSNLADSLCVANSLVRAGKLEIPKGLPSLHEGLSIVNSVEKLVTGTLLRQRGPALARQLEGLADHLHSRNHTFGANPPNHALSVALALYLWHGCLFAEKMLRDIAANGRPYTPESRAWDHQVLMQEIAFAEAVGNPWIRFGATLGRHLRRSRMETIFDEGIPRDSPVLSS